MNKYSKIIEVKGHLIDSLVLTKIFDRVMDLDGKFEVMKISVGKLKTDESYAKLRVIGKNKTHLSEIMTVILIFRHDVIPKSKFIIILRCPLEPSLHRDLLFVRLQKL